MYPSSTRRSCRGRGNGDLRGLAQRRHMHVYYVGLQHVFASQNGLVGHRKTTKMWRAPAWEANENPQVSCCHNSDCSKVHRQACGRQWHGGAKQCLSGARPTQQGRSTAVTFRNGRCLGGSVPAAGCDQLTQAAAPTGRCNSPVCQQRQISECQPGWLTAALLGCCSGPGPQELPQAFHCTEVRAVLLAPEPPP